MAITRTYGKLNFNDVNWIIPEAEPHICIKLKAIFSKINKTSSPPFKFNDSPEVCTDLLWFMERYPLAISEMDMLRLNTQKEVHADTINQLESIMLPDYKAEPKQLRNGLIARNYQLTGTDLYLKTKRILIGDDIGLGKTLIGILSCLEPQVRPCLIVVQTHLTKQWKDEINRFTNLSVQIIKGTRPYSLKPTDVYIIKYSCLAGWVDLYKSGYFKSVIFDEVQELRHATSNKYHAAYHLTDNVQYCLGLSASPIYNYGDEIFNVIDVIKKGSLGERYDFMREWTNFGKVVTEPKALGSYMRENFLMIRRTRKEVGRELPPINKIVHTVGHDEHEVKKSEDIARQLAIKVTSGSFMERGQAARELDLFVRQSTGISKAREVAQYVKMILETGEPVVLAGWHHAVYDIWLEELKEYKPVMFTGRESETQKKNAKEAFVNGETNLFIISLRSGIGLDGLQKRCKMIVIGELDWSPKVHDQLIGRVDRDGQEEQVTAIFLTCEYGSDPLIIDLLGLKSSQSHSIINPLQSEIEEQYVDESRLKLLAQRFLQKKELKLELE